LVEGLIQGPRDIGSRTLPEDTRLRAVYLLNDGTCVLDFAEDAFNNHPGGVSTELLSIYAIVNTLVLNIEAVRSVKILIGGNEAAVLAGHVSLQQPFTANMLWVR
jgi:spore germination protein GerM